ncbi:MAG: hypothetical protein HZC40_22785 [Chloroflexi bacterium]|nr:hypothetical protein [Chloroflexota bacterium]
MNYKKSGMMLTAFALLVITSKLFLADSAFAFIPLAAGTPPATTTNFTVTPVLLKTSTAIPTQPPSPSATRTATAIRTSTSAPTRTLLPTNTPLATHTPIATSIATVTPGVQPTEILDPTETPEPTETPLPTYPPEVVPTSEITNLGNPTPTRTRTPNPVPTHISVSWFPFFDPAPVPTRNRLATVTLPNRSANATVTRTAIVTRGTPTLRAIAGLPTRLPDPAITRIARAPENRQVGTPDGEAASAVDEQPEEMLDAESDAPDANQNYSLAIRFGKIASFLASAITFLGAGALGILALYFFGRARARR